MASTATATRTRSPKAAWVAVLRVLAMIAGFVLEAYVIRAAKAVWAVKVLRLITWPVALVWALVRFVCTPLVGLITMRADRRGSGTRRVVKGFRKGRKNGRRALAIVLG